jgi:fatty-acyl-CoA synthase
LRLKIAPSGPTEPVRKIDRRPRKKVRPDETRYREDQTMAGIHLLDRAIGSDYPSFTSTADIRAFEQTPYATRIAAQSTFDALKCGAAANPDAPAIQFLANADPADTPLVLSYRDLVAKVTQAANMFHALGIGPDDVVSFLLPLTPEAFITLLGAEAAGIANPVNPLLEPHQIAEILEAARTKVLVALGPLPGTDIWQKVEKVRGGLTHLKAVVQVHGGGNAADGIHAFNDLITPQPADHLVSGRQIAAADIAAYFHTGGTTGTPKLVRHSHGNQVYQAWAMNLLLKTKPGGSLLFGMPLFHVGGSLTQTLATLGAGGCLVVLSPAGWRNPNSIRNIWRLVERFRPETLSSVPTVLAAALAVPPGTADISSLRATAGGGSAIPVAVGHAIQDKLKLPVFEVYGMTETASVHTIAYPDQPIRLGSVGLPLPYSRVRVVKLDADGFLWITGRAKDLVIRGGHNIDPAPIEEIMFQHPAVGFAAVVGQPDAYAGELPVGYVQLKPGASVQPGELEAWVRERTPERAAVPVQVIPVDPMPLTGVGKVFKPQLRWDAATRVFARVLAQISDRGIDCTVKVGPHGSHGSIATVTLRGVSGDVREAVENEVHTLLAPFVIRHEVVHG